jgi:hypothetical protein
VLLNLHGPAPAVDIATGAVLALGGLAAADSWGVDVSALMMNAIVWAYLGVLVVALVVLMRRATGRR